MSFPFDDRYRRGSQRSVPLETARKIARQRDELASEVEELRRKNKQLAQAQKQAETDNAELRERAQQAEEQVRQLQKKLDELQGELADREPSEPDSSPKSPQEDSDLVGRLKERIERLNADLERLRSRSETRGRDARREERIRLLSGLGEVLDSIERGLSMQAEGPWREGLLAIHAQLLNFLRNEGATLTGEVGEAMNPELHEAVDVVDSTEHASGEIVEVDRHGVLLEDGTVVRPARVKVAD